MYRRWSSSTSTSSDAERPKCNKVVELADDLSYLCIRRPRGSCEIDGTILKYLTTTTEICIQGNLCDRKGGTRWGFPKCLEHVEFIETVDVLDAIKQLPQGIESLEITSTVSLEFLSLLKRFDKMQKMIIRSPYPGMNMLPPQLQILELDCLDIDIDDGNGFGDLDLSTTVLKGIHFDVDCEFSLEGAIIVPQTLESLTLNRTCVSELQQLPPDTLCNVSVDYPFRETLQGCRVVCYDE